jgi:putative oligomerization/nucleic acid binding protein
MARTAVVAGTATAVSNRVSRRQANRWAAEEPQYAEPQYAAPPPQAAPAAPTESRVDKLKELAALKEQGILTDEEFAAEKARILAS